MHSRCNSGRLGGDKTHLDRVLPWMVIGTVGETMIEIPVLNSSGQQVGALKVDEKVLGGEVRHALLKQAYVRLHANRRQGTSATKNRALVEGSTRKLYKQKHTGNARRGSIRTNIMRGGGVAHAKKPHSWRL